MPLHYFLTPHDEHESGNRKGWRKTRVKPSLITIWSTYTWSRFDYREKAKSKNSVLLSHARVHISNGTLSHTLFFNVGRKTRSVEYDESASKSCLQHRVYNAKTQLIDTNNPLSGGLRKTSAQYYRATIESLSSPILKAATTKCEKCIFSSFFLPSLAFRSTFALRKRDTGTASKDIER